jgi:hypothetical protein
MSGTTVGGKKAALKAYTKDPDYFRKIGAKGGRKGHTGGFTGNPERARIIGSIGGRNGKRGPRRQGYEDLARLIIKP